MKASELKPAAFELADAIAVQAVTRGEATAEQQIRAIKWIVENACAYYDLSYRPGKDGDRDTAFFEGRRFAGAQVVHLTKVKLSTLMK